MVEEVGSEGQPEPRPDPPPLGPVESVSVLIPTWQGIEFIERVFDALAGQRFSRTWDVRVIDSGSTDGTWEHLAARVGRFPVPLALERIHQLEFDHGDTRNALAARSRGDLLVFLTQDAIPSSQDWLAQLARNFDDPRVGAAYCRNVPRDDAHVLTKVFCRGDPGYGEQRVEARLPDAETYAAMSAFERRLLYNFNDVASAIRRELWARHPFPRTTMGEDVLMARAILEAGYTVVYDADATIDHSHDYGPDKMHWRGEVDAKFNAEWLDRLCVAAPDEIPILTDRLVAEDMRILREDGVPAEQLPALEVEARALRAASVQGLFDGSQAARRYPRTVLLQRPELHVMLVTTMLPPHRSDESATYALNLAHELRRRGHRVTLLARSPARDGEPDLTMHREHRDGLEVLAIAARDPLDHPLARYQDTRLDALFAEALTETRPDVVHFLHLRGFSTGLVAAARARGVPTVLSCDDDFGLCARGDLRRPDGVRCETNMGSGCWLCAHELALTRVADAHALDADDEPKTRTAAALRRLTDLARAVAPDSGYARLRDREESMLRAYRRADLRICPSRHLRDRYLTTGRFDPHTFVYSQRGVGAGPIPSAEPLGNARSPLADDPEWLDHTRRSLGPSKTLPHDAAEMEFRYRSLCCIDRQSHASGEALLNAAGASAHAEGPVVAQGAGWLLLRPGASAAFPLDDVPAGPVTVEIEQYALAQETGVRLGGRALIDGVEVGRFPVREGFLHDQSLRDAFDTDIAESARRIVIEPSLGATDPSLYLRVCRLKVFGRED